MTRKESEAHACSRREGVAAMRNLMCLLLAVLCTTGLVQGQKELRGKLAGKVSSLLPRTRAAQVSGRQVDLSRLVKDAAQRERILQRMAEPLDQRVLDNMRERRIRRYGGSSVSFRTALTDCGEEVHATKPPRTRRVVEKTDDGESLVVILVFAGVFAGSIFFTLKSRS